jgi:spermidine synthase
MTFPLLTDLAARPDEASARDVGRAYSLNTLGSIVGAVLTGFVLVVAWGTDWSLRLGLGITAASGLALAIATVWGVPEGSAEHKRLRTRALGGALLASIGLTGVFAVPHWSTRLIDLGPTIYGRGLITPKQRDLFLQHAGLRQLAFREGRNSTISVWESAAGRNLKVNGKVDASDFGDMDTQVMLALAPVIFHPHAHAALAVGFGSGVTTATLAAAPGMDRVRVVELEPAVLSVAPLFREVNGDVLGRSNVQPIVDDARSALQLSRDTYDVIVSEPSNPWVAGVATLYTTEFYHIVQRRLTPGGVFCQWVQLYQLPLPVVAGIVRNVHAVFPHVEIYFGGTADLMVLGSDRPFAIDSTWLAQVIGAGAPLARSAHEYLGLDSPAQFADRRVLGETGVARLIARATLTHRDDRPELEFVAARNFLRTGASVPLDSLVAISVAAGERPELQPGLARIIGTPLGEQDAYSYVLPLHRAYPADDEWTVALAAIGVRLGDSALADSTFPRILRTTRNPALLLLAGEMAVNRKLSGEAGPLLARALAAGADTAAADAADAKMEGRREHWAAAAAAIRAAIRATHNTYRSPFPRDELEDVLRSLALKGPPPLADSVLAEVVAARPGWAHAHEWRAAAALRNHGCQEAANQFVELVDFGIFREDGPALVSACQRGR